MNSNKCIIFSDGACSGNPGPGGWGSVVLLPNQIVTELGGGEVNTTNNRMEMMAALKALIFIKKHHGSVDFYTDSTYLIRGITQWIWGWKRNGWRTAEGNEVSNRDVWEELAAVVSARGVEGKIDWKYSRGHIGIPGNERCDEIAVAFSKQDHIHLFQGELSAYHVDLLQLPLDTKLPDMKSPGEKKAAFSYLSNIGGVVFRHKDWSSCERRVKGQSGAKFKKTTSAANEQEVLKSWGLSAQTTIKDV